MRQPRWSDRYNDDYINQPNNFYKDSVQGACGEYSRYARQPYQQQNRSLLYSFDNTQQWIFAGLYPDDQSIQQAKQAIQMANFGRIVWFQERQS